MRLLVDTCRFPDHILNPMQFPPQSCRARFPAWGWSHRAACASPELQGYLAASSASAYSLVSMVQRFMAKTWNDMDMFTLAFFSSVDVTACSSGSLRIRANHAQGWSCHLAILRCSRALLFTERWILYRN